jgi:hypothetical protein
MELMINFNKNDSFIRVDRGGGRQMTVLMYYHTQNRKRMETSQFANDQFWPVYVTTEPL